MAELGTAIPLALVGSLLFFSRRKEFCDTPAFQPRCRGHSTYGFHKAKVLGVEGFEPPTYGLGKRSHVTTSSEILLIPANLLDTAKFPLYVSHFRCNSNAASFPIASLAFKMRLVNTF
jgi:hypothetical protein